MYKDLYLGYLKHINHEIENVLPILEEEANARRSGTAEKYQVINLRTNLSLIRKDLTDFIKEEEIHEEREDSSNLSAGRSD